MDKSGGKGKHPWRKIFLTHPLSNCTDRREHDFSMERPQERPHGLH